MKNKKLAVVSIMASLFAATYVVMPRSLEESDVHATDKKIAPASAAVIDEPPSSIKKIQSNEEHLSTESALAEQSIDIESLKAILEQGNDLDVKRRREQERDEFLEKLRFKPYSVQAFFEQESASYEEWALAYETEICDCETHVCMKSLQNDYLKFSPPFLDKIQTPAAQQSMHRVIECVGAIQ